MSCELVKCVQIEGVHTVHWFDNFLNWQVCHLLPVHRTTKLNSGEILSVCAHYLLDIGRIFPFPSTLRKPIHSLVHSQFSFHLCTEFTANSISDLGESAALAAATTH